VTVCLEGRCSIQLSYRTINVLNKQCTVKQKSPETNRAKKSGWQDSNLRPSAPKADALTGLRYTPKQKTTGGERGIRTPGTLIQVRQFSKLVVSATHPPLQKGLQI
jgi:hypothetical protein